MHRTEDPVGRDTPRIDGPRKVTGQAQYTSDFRFPGMLYAVPVEATIANSIQRRPRKCQAFAPSFIAQTSDQFSVRPLDRDSRASAMNGVRHSKTM